jgi:hypothetical protein
MQSLISTCRAGLLALAASTVFALPALAADDLLKPAPTPAPAAGPTVAAAQFFCGDTIAKADELFTRYSSDKKLTEIYKSVDYIAYADNKDVPTVMYTFTVKGHPAHPTAVCRKQSKEGDNIVLKMEIVCDAGKESCDALRNDFNVMNAKMQAAIDTKIKEQAGK